MDEVGGTLGRRALLRSALGVLSIAAVGGLATPARAATNLDRAGSELYKPEGDYLNYSRPLAGNAQRGRVRNGSNVKVDPATNVVTVQQGDR